MGLYNNDVKQRSREAIAQFIRANASKPLGECKVFTLLGADNENEVALELESLWLPLGVKPVNITTVERDKASHTRLTADAQKRGYQIPSQPTTVEDFFENHPARDINSPAPFDIIYLDYMGHQTEKERKTLWNIAGKLLIDHHGIFISNHAAKREHPKQSQARTLQALITRQSAGENLDIQDFVNVMDQGWKTAGLTMDELRDQVTINTQDAFWDSLLLRDSARILEFLPNKEEVIQRVQEAVLVDKIKGRGVSLLASKINQILGTKEPEQFANEGLLHKFTKEKMSAILAEELDKRGHHFPPNIPSAIVNVITRRRGEGYFRRNIERWEYTSSSNMTMNLDAFAFAPLSDTYKPITDLIGWDFNAKRPRIFFTNTKQLRQALIKLSHSLVPCLAYPERVFLGNAWVPPSRNKEVEAANKAESLPPSDIGSLEAAIRSGKKISELISSGIEIPEDKLGRLRALQAHATMRATKQAQPEDTVAGR